MNQTDANTSLRLESRLCAIMNHEYPRFSDAEYARRHGLLGEVMGNAGVDQLLAVTDQRNGSLNIPSPASPPPQPSPAPRRKGGS